MTDLHRGFRDPDQLRRAQAVIQYRLADDREQNECRYLMRFHWQLLMSYREVTMQELRTHVSLAKLEAVEALVEAIAHSPEQIDGWIRSMEKTFPIIHDRGYSQD